MSEIQTLRGEEKIIQKLRALYYSYGYRLFRMRRFEEYDLYAGNKDFLSSPNIITFTDTNGKLMALKPDVTLSIVRSTRDEAGKVSRICYDENVYRVSEQSGTFREIMQAGLECIGDLGASELAEVARLAQLSLGAVSDKAVLSITHMGIVEGFMCGLPQDLRAAAVSGLSARNVSFLENKAQENPQFAKVFSNLAKLCTLSGGNGEIFACLKELGADKKALDELKAVVGKLDGSSIRLDFSILDGMKYYNGITFRGYMDGIPVPVVSGGQYDKLMTRMGRTSRAAGFAVYLDFLERLSEKPGVQPEAEGKMLRVALPKGRLGEKVYSMFARAGYDCPGILDDSRKLIFENRTKGISYFWVKPSDVAVYVERGAADIGVAGKDIIDEYSPDVYEMLDLKTGICRMCVAAKKGFADNTDMTLRVATKFANIAGRYYGSVGREIDVIHLNGSIELAPVLGMSDVIVDIVETGTTLKENGLEVIETIMPISARLIANKAAYEFKKKEILGVMGGLRQVVEEKA